MFVCFELTVGLDSLCFTIYVVLAASWFVVGGYRCWGIGVFGWLYLVAVLVGLICDVVLLMCLLCAINLAVGLWFGNVCLYFGYSCVWFVCA